MFSLFAPRTFYGKLFLGYGIFLLLFTIATGGVLFQLFSLQIIEKGINPVTEENVALQEALAALSALDGAIARYDPIQDPGLSSDRISTSGSRYAAALVQVEAHATLDETKARLGLLKETSTVLLSSARDFPSSIYSDVDDRRLTLFQESRSVRTVLTSIAETTNATLRTKEENRQTFFGRSASLIGLIALIFFMIGITFAIIVSRTIADPLRRIKDSAIRIASGTYDMRIPEKGRGDTRELARAFNAMADRLTHYNQELEREVAVRTKDINEKIDILGKLNRELDQNATLLMKRDMELTRANERLRELDRLKSEFLSVAAHQLRTPLSAVKWIFSMILEGQIGALSPELKSILEKGRDSNERMVRLVDDMLAVTRIEGGRTEYAFAVMGAKELLLDIAAPFAKAAEDRGIRFVMGFPETSSDKVLVDPQKIRFVFDNLLDNAVKYTPSGGTVSLDLHPKGEVIEVVISDSGIGIPESEQKNIFTKFFRASNAMKVVTDGNGLGLFVVKTIVERHGGSVGFESTPGKGTTFAVSLPIISSEPGTVSDPLDLPSATSSSPQSLSVPGV